MTGIIIRGAELADLNNLEGALSSAPYKFTKKNSEWKLQSPDWRILLACYNDRIVGILTMNIPDGSPGLRMIDVVQVSNDFQRKGVARMLVQEIEILVTLEKRRLLLWAYVEKIRSLKNPKGEPNVASERLLIKMGFIYNQQEGAYYKRIN